MVSRDTKILSLHKNGMSRRELAERFSLSKARIDQILWKGDPSIKKNAKKSSGQEIVSFCKKLKLDLASVKGINLPEDDIRFLLESEDSGFAKDYLLAKGAKKVMPTSRVTKPSKSSKLDDRGSKPSARSLLNLIQSSSLTVFTAELIQDKLGEFCGSEIEKNKVFSYLNTLKKHGYIKRTLRGTYELTDKIKPLILAEKEIKKEEENLHNIIEKSDNFVKTKLHTIDALKKPERLAVENFISKFKIPGKKFVFTTSDLHKHYPNMDKKRLSKATQNMFSYGFLKKGSKLGEYIFEEKGDTSSAVQSSIVHTFQIIV